MPPSVAADLIAIVDAVAAGPPPQFRGGGMWEAMHGSMKGYYEARTRGPDRRLYRLFSFLEREALGFSGHSLFHVPLAGRAAYDQRGPGRVHASSGRPDARKRVPRGTTRHRQARRSA